MPDDDVSLPQSRVPLPPDWDQEKVERYLAARSQARREWQAIQRARSEERAKTFSVRLGKWKAEELAAFREALFNEKLQLPADWPKGLSHKVAREIYLKRTSDGKTGIDAIWGYLRRQSYECSRHQVKYVIEHVEWRCEKCKTAASEARAIRADQVVLDRLASRRH